jgi:transposase InsO family protein
MLYSLPTLTVATSYDVHKATVHRWAKRESWASVPHKGKGGGEDWLMHSMPKERQRFLNNAHMREEMARLASKQSEVPVNRTAKAQPLSGIPEHGQRVAEARAFVANYALTLHKTTGRALSNILFEVARLFEERSDVFPEWVYQALRGASRCSIRNWINEEKENGLRRLAKQHERRASRGIIENTPELKDIALGMLWEYPHTSAKAIERAFKARFGPHGSTPDPSIKLPHLRRIQAWRKNWLAENEQLFLARINPDASRSKHKAAFGDAAAHVHYINQEWQSDGTLCELMLNDGRRHTLNLTLDVFTRRLRFHVSRTSSAAAVASGMRKAILDWGLCDTWKTDNGKDYDNTHMQRVCATLNIYHELCPPFSPEKKPFVERAFKTFLHSHVELLAGYLGHNVAERKAIEARKSFGDRLYKKLKTPGDEVRLNLSPEELQKICDDWAEYVYGNDPHSGLDGMTPNEKAAACADTIKHMPDERALDVLLLPVPGKNGIRTVGKPGISITSKQHGLSIKGHYFSTDTAALMGCKVLVRFDDTCLGRVLLFTPDTHEYLGKAEHPGLMGWTHEDVRNEAVASERRRKALVAAEKKAWREAAKRADVGNISTEIIDEAKRRAAASAPMPEQPSVPYTTPALEQAARARTGDFTVPTEEEQARAMADLERMLTPEEPKGFVVPESIGEKIEFWRTLYDRRVAGENLEAKAATWFRGFARTEYCKAYCLLHGLDISLAVNG